MAIAHAKVTDVTLIKGARTYLGKQNAVCVLQQGMQVVQRKVHVLAGGAGLNTNFGLTACVKKLFDTLRHSSRCCRNSLLLGLLPKHRAWGQAIGTAPLPVIQGATVTLSRRHQGLLNSLGATL